MYLLEPWELKWVLLERIESIKKIVITDLCGWAAEISLKSHHAKLRQKQISKE